MRYYLAGLLLLVAIAESAIAAAPVATYQFRNNFNADEPVIPALFPIDPLGTSVFRNDVVLGHNRRVWSYDGLADPAFAQAGLLANTAGLISPTNYSVDMVFRFTEGAGNWRRIFDVAFQQSDNGFYVEPAANLQVYPDLTGSTGAWTEGVYHHVVLTNQGTNVAAYLDGVLQFSGVSPWTTFDNVNNPGQYLIFFLDNAPGTGFSDEYADGRVALIRLWNNVLTNAEAQQLAANPFFVPEASGALLAVFGLVLSCFAQRRLR